VFPWAQLAAWVTECIVVRDTNAVLPQKAESVFVVVLALIARKVIVIVEIA
jgi:hypothetical protein